MTDNVITPLYLIGVSKINTAYATKFSGCAGFSSCYVRWLSNAVTSRHIMSSHVTSSSIICSKTVQANKESVAKVPHYSSFVNPPVTGTKNKYYGKYVYFDIIKHSWRQGNESHLW